jgi:CTP synthase (UTP-ammonia lyase)
MGLLVRVPVLIDGGLNVGMAQLLLDEVDGLPRSKPKRRGSVSEVLEYARNVLGFEDAQHAEYDPYASDLFITELSCSLAGQKMAVQLSADSRAAQLYGRTEISERYYCNFGLNPKHQQLLDDGGLRVVGVDGEARVLELPDRRFFVATLFVPQLSSSPESPHPLITAYLRAAVPDRIRSHT